MIDQTELAAFLHQTYPELRLGLGVAHLDETHALAPDETPAVARARPGRKAEFAAGRAAARAALCDMGQLPYAIPMGYDRAPLWPSGVVGSISHSGEMALAVVARKADLRGLGCDLEPALPLEPSLWPEIISACERAALMAEDSGVRGLMARAIFSAKEACFKALYPRVGEMAGFDLMEITLAPQGHGRFTAMLRRDYGPYSEGTLFAGQICLTPRAIFSLSALPKLPQCGENMALNSNSEMQCFAANSR